MQKTVNEWKAKKEQKQGNAESSDDEEEENIYAVSSLVNFRFKLKKKNIHSLNLFLVR